MKLAELSLHYSVKVKVEDRQVVKSTVDGVSILKNIYSETSVDHIEMVYALFLNRRNQVIGYNQISKGGVSGTVVDIRVILQHALLCNASAIILSHNHPSGLPQPSMADKAMTTRLKEACKLMEIQLCDHIILCSEDSYSFAENGDL
jgi:DNA repair protein RadC